MPIYEYKCSKCGKVFEKIQKFSDAPVETHDACGGAVERLFSTPSLQFKGSGFYITDYPKGSSKASESKDSKGSKDSKDSKESKPAATETKTESKPAATETKTKSD